MIHDIDMKERTIDINHQLQRLSDMEYIIEPTKTNAGKRVLPMTQDVYECFQKILKNRKAPKITPHVCRHTYCISMALAGMNPKTLQYLMGHSEIGVTLDVYTHVSFEDARDEVEKINTV